MSNNPHLPAALNNPAIWMAPKAKIAMKKVRTAQGYIVTERIDIARVTQRTFEGWREKGRALANIFKHMGSQITVIHRGYRRFISSKLPQKNRNRQSLPQKRELQKAASEVDN